MRIPGLRGDGFNTSRLPRAWPKILGITLVACVSTYAELVLRWRTPTLGVAPFTILGVALSIFLGFRNNTAYTRFWEARTLWGALINAARCFARQVMTLVSSNDPTLRPYQEDVVLATVAYCHSLAHRLRGTDPFAWIERAMQPEESRWLRTQENVPVAILHLIGRRLAWARERGWIDAGATILLEGSLTDMTNVQGGCERIKNTPVPETYSLLSGAIVTLFCLFLPFGILDVSGRLTPLVVFLVAYAFYGLDALGEEITEPFGHDPHDLPLEQYADTIETNLRQLLSDVKLPDFEVPDAEPTIKLSEPL